ncbi:MAG: lysozyme [Prevotella sp.]|nr:lysozyme [Prevotella sp.]
MRASETLIHKIKEFEGLRLESYKCPAGVWTIGIGHTKGVKKGQRITEAQAWTLLRGDLLPCEQYVERLGMCRTQGEFDSLVDFAFNLGTGKLASSTLLRKIREGASETVVRKEFSRWVYSNGVKLDGLVKRRAWEADRFFGKS